MQLLRDAETEESEGSSMLFLFSDSIVEVSGSSTFTFNMVELDLCEYLESVETELAALKTLT